MAALREGTYRIKADTLGRKRRKVSTVENALNTKAVLFEM